MAYPKTLKDFYNILSTNGVKKTHQFQFNFSGLPNGLDSELEDLTQWYATGLKLPDMNQKTTDIAYLAYKFKIPTVMDFGGDRTINLTISCDGEMRIYNAVKEWFNYVSDHDIEGGSVGGGVKTISTVKMHLDLFDDNFKTIQNSYVLYGCQPKNIGDIQLGNEDPKIMTFDMTVKYQYWQPN